MRQNIWMTTKSYRNPFLEATPRPPNAQAESTCAASLDFLGKRKIASLPAERLVIANEWRINCQRDPADACAAQSATNAAVNRNSHCSAIAVIANDKAELHTSRPFVY